MNLSIFQNTYEFFFYFFYVFQNTVFEKILRLSYYPIIEDVTSKIRKVIYVHFPKFSKKRKKRFKEF